MMKSLWETIIFSLTWWGENPPVKPHHRGSSCPDAPWVNLIVLLITIMLMLSSWPLLCWWTWPSSTHTCRATCDWSSGYNNPGPNHQVGGLWIFKSRCKGVGRGSSWRARSERQLCWWQVKLPGGIKSLPSFSHNFHITVIIFTISIIILIFF